MLEQQVVEDTSRNAFKNGLQKKLKKDKDDPLSPRPLGWNEFC